MRAKEARETKELLTDANSLLAQDTFASEPQQGRIESGLEELSRIVGRSVPHQRTPRSTLATYTGIFDQIKVYLLQPKKQNPWCDAGHFSFNVAKGGAHIVKAWGGIGRTTVYAECLFPCTICNGQRFNVTYWKLVTTNILSLMYYRLRLKKHYLYLVVIKLLRRDLKR